MKHLPGYQVEEQYNYNLLQWKMQAGNKFGNSETDLVRNIFNRYLNGTFKILIPNEEDAIKATLEHLSISEEKAKELEIV